MSTFGGPEDTGVSRGEGLALFEHHHLGDGKIREMFLPKQPPGTTGLARRLNPNAFYVACRWPYKKVPKSVLRNARVIVRANGKSISARPVDFGPARWTRRVADISPGAAKALGVETDDIVELQLYVPSSKKDGGPKEDEEVLRNSAQCDSDAEDLNT